MNKNKPRRCRALQPGDRVCVYTDPLTERTLEGIATLRKRIGPELGGYERWLVEFVDLNGTWERSVRPINRDQAKPEPEGSKDDLE